MLSKALALTVALAAGILLAASVVGASGAQESTISTSETVPSVPTETTPTPIPPPPPPTYRVCGRVTTERMIVLKCVRSLRARANKARRVAHLRRIQPRVWFYQRSTNALATWVEHNWRVKMNRARRAKRVHLRMHRRDPIFSRLPHFGIPMWWAEQARCVHNHEASWHNPSGIGPNVSGGMQIGSYEWGISGGLRFAPAAYLATPIEQLRVAWRYYRLTGSDWSPWPTYRNFCA